MKSEYHTMLPLILLGLLPRLIAACQPGCACLTPSDVSCVASSLTSLPVWQDAIHDAVSLDLSLNDVTELEPDAFRGLSKLETLLLNYNQISDVDTFALSELRHLTHVELENNVIETLDPLTFISNPALESLSLSGNPIRLTSHFLISESITSLDLSHCNLKTIPSGAFAGLSKLDTLVLTHNTLQCLPVDLFASLPSLQLVYLHGNPWQCDDVEDLRFSQRDVIADFKKLRCVATEVSTTSAVVEEVNDEDDEETEELDVLHEIRVLSEEADDVITVELLACVVAAVLLVAIIVVVVRLRKNIKDCWLRRSTHELLQSNENLA